LKSPKNVDRILMVLGLQESDVKRLEEVDKELSRKAQVLTKLQDLQKRYQLLKEMRELEEELEDLKRKVKGNLIVSSATGRAKGNRVRLFTRLLGFTPGGVGEGVRNVVDSYSRSSDVVEVVKKLGKGGLVFVPADLGAKGAEEVAEALRAAGVAAEVATSERIGVIKDFEEGRVEVLVGVATHYGVLVRGIDLPHVVRYAVFVGVPRFKFKLKLEEPSPMTIYRLCSLAARFFEECASLYAKLRKWVQRLGPAGLQSVEEALKEGSASTPASKDFMEAYTKLKEIIEKTDFIEKLKESGEVDVVAEDSLYVLIPDAATYLQASGRTSRLYAGGVTKGLSVVLVDSEPLFRGLKKRLAWVVEEWKEFESLNLSELLKEIDEDRKKVLKVIRGELKVEEVRDLMKTVLMIVESPNKARTITSFFGRPSVRQVKGVKVYEVTLGDKLLYVAASGGHVYDLVEEADPCNEEPCMLFGIRVKDVPEEVLSSIKLCGHQFSGDVKECPRCGSPFIKDAKDVVDGLRELAQEVDEVLIGTDPDTEGEKIGWDLKNLISPFAKKIRRAEFHEITKKAILKALENPRDFDMGYVWSQMVRRAEDRLTGFTLSPKLWFELWPQLCEVSKEMKKKLLGCPLTRNLSAGRVQTPVLGWVIQRYEEYAKSKKKFYIIRFDGRELEFSEDELRGFSKKLAIDGKVKILKVEEEVEELKPLPPYTTDTMLEDASKLGLDPSRAMRVAQDLFEMGFITYHRTDSTRVSDAGIAVAREWITSKFEGLFAPRRWGEGGAHEAIRPTRPLSAEDLKRLIEEGMITPPRELSKQHFMLYDMIFRRFMASQMKEAKVKKAVYEITVEEGGAVVGKKVLEKYVERVFDGFLLVYPIVKIESLPEGEYEVKEVRAVSRHTVPLYTQADLIRLMKERGLGRPSTYAKIVSTLLERRYVTLSKVGKKLVPTVRGYAVYSYLTGKVVGAGWVRKALEVIINPEGKSKYFQKLVEEEATRRLEKVMDEIAEKKDEKMYINVLKDIIEETKVIPFLSDKGAQPSLR